MNYNSKLIYKFVFFIIGCNLSPGLYPYSQRYVIDKSSMYNARYWESFKEINNLNLPKDVLYFDQCDKEDTSVYHVYFFIEEFRGVFHCTVMTNIEKEIEIALVGVDFDLNPGGWKIINRDFERTENKDLIQIFESRVISKIRKN